MRKILYILAIFLSFSCSDKVEPLGNLEMTVEKVVSVNGIPYEELQIGIFPTESLITKDFSAQAAIMYQKLVNGKVRFEGLLPDTYNVGLIVTYYPQPASHKLVQVKPGQTVTIELIKN